MVACLSWQDATGDRQLRAAELADPGHFDRAAEFTGHGLEGVADREHRDPGLEQGRVDARVAKVRHCLSRLTDSSTTLRFLYFSVFSSTGRPCAVRLDFWSSRSGITALILSPRSSVQSASAE